MPYRLKKEDLAYRKIGDAYYVLTVPDSTLHHVTGVGVRVLELLDGGKDEAAILDQLSAEFDVDAAELARDLDAFFADLAAKGIVTPDGE
jgi:hypothetical protein